MVPTKKQTSRSNEIDNTVYSNMVFGKNVRIFGLFVFSFNRRFCLYFPFLLPAFSCHDADSEYLSISE